MGKISDLFVKLRLDNKQYDKELGESAKKTSTFGKGISKIGGLIAGAFAIRAVTNFAKESIRLYDIQAQAENQLLVALKGRADAQRVLIDQAQELQGKTLFGDEETIRAQALIAAFVKEENQIKKIIPLVQDLATAKGMQLAGAADLVSKTLGSSTNALSRYGIEVEGAVGSVERLESLMLGLNNAFEGQAEAAAKVGSGPIKQLSNAYGDLREEIGRAIATGGAFEGFINGIGSSLTKTQQLMFVWNSEFATTMEKWAISIELSDKRAEKIYNNVKKRTDDANRRNKETADALQAIIDENDAANKSKEESVKVEEKHIKTIGELIAETDLLTKSVNDYGVNQDAEIQKTLSQIQANKDLIQELTSLKRTQDALVPDKIEGKGTPSFENIVAEEGGLSFIGGFIEKQKASSAATQKEINDATLAQEQIFVDDMNSMINDGMADFVSTFAEGIGRLASGDISFDQFFDSILNQIGGFLVQFGSALIAYGVASDAFTKAFSNPYVAIAAGVALVAVGGLISSMGSKGPQGFSGGGGGSIPSGSFSAPARAEARDDRVIFELQGTKLVGAINNTNRRNSIIG